MKSSHRQDLFFWSVFDEQRNIDFNSSFWHRDSGNVAIDPLPLSHHNASHVDALGGISCILLTNADHVRDTARLGQRYGAKIYAPAAEQKHPDLACLEVDGWLRPGETHPCGITCIDQAGSKGLAGELAFLLPPGDTVICGDLVRGQQGGSLNLLPEAKMTDPSAAHRSVRALSQLPDLEAVIVGDGHCVFRDAKLHLLELLN